MINKIVFSFLLYIVLVLKVLSFSQDYEHKNEKKEVFTQTSLFELSEEEVKKEEKTNEIEEKIKKINPLEMSPMEALNFLYELKKNMK